MPEGVTVEFPSAWAQVRPDHAAVVDARTDDVLTYRRLDDRSRALAHQLIEWGLGPGDHLVIVMSNRIEFLEVCWAAQRIGLYYTAINTHLTVREALIVLDDCGARAAVVDDAYPELAAAVAGAPQITHRLLLGEARAHHDDYETAAARVTGALEHECEGEKMLYTSGTTGVPKGVARPLTGGPPGSVFFIHPMMARMGFGEDTVLVDPGPLYHSAPLGYAMGVHRLGGTVVVSGRFDAAGCLASIERHRATHGLFVPTMFVRMLRVGDRARYDLASLACAVHGAAPCPPAVKRQMIEWWGPILTEYYAGTEGAGMTVIDSAEWLAHPGSVGRTVGGAVHVVDGTGAELPAGEVGDVYFEGGSRFRYHRDDAKTAAAYDGRGWSTLGDVGYLDDEGYLFLTDRTAFTVISGGVNLYPQEVEDVLAGHPAVADVAAFGEPDDDLGEALVAVVQPLDPAAAGPALAAELAAFCAANLSRQKCPRRIDFRDALPRADNGKLYKRALVEEYRRPTSSSTDAGDGATIVPEPT